MTVLVPATVDALAASAQRGDLRALGELLRDLNAALNPDTRIVNVTASTTLTQAVHDGKTITANAAAGLTLTLPAATGSGMKVRIIVGTTITSNDLIVQVVGDDTMTGTCLFAQDSADTAVLFETASTSDTITMNGTTKGGIKGDLIELEDIAADLWHVRIVGSATGTEATPFSAAVS